MSHLLELYDETCPQKLGTNQAALGFRLVCEKGVTQHDYGLAVMPIRSIGYLLSAVAVLCERAEIPDEGRCMILNRAANIMGLKKA